MTPRIVDQPSPRFSVSLLPPEVEQAEKDFVKLLERALAPSFALVRRLGAGGMGSVYLARDPVLKRLVAVKVMSPGLAADAAARARFEREAEAVAAISHPNVVSIYSVGELENGVPYLVMQYVEGRTMADRLQEDGALEVGAAKRILGEVASALAAAHKKGIIHRDIKPANILWDDETGRALVTDFGIAAVLEKTDDREAIRITQTGMAIGTPAFMSPEQLLAEEVTDKTDIYSLGLLGYELLIADGPYQVSSPRELMAAHLRDTPRRLSLMRADVDPELERLLEGCLVKDPKQRPSAAEVETRLAHGASVLLEWPPPGLEQLGASLRAALRVLYIGAFAAGLPVVALSVFDRESLVRQTLPPTLALLMLTFVGFLTFAFGLALLDRFLRHAVKTVATGYGWGTIAEVVADTRGDTGVLIAGGREYAELAPAARSAMRRNRVIAMLLRVAAGLAPVLGYAIGVLTAARSANGPTIVLWSSILFALSLLATARLIGWQENRTMQPARKRMRTAAVRTEGLHRLAEAWKTTFEQVRVGQRFGPGRPSRGRGARIAMAAVLVLCTLVSLGIMVVLTLTTTIGVATGSTFPRFTNSRARVTRIQRLDAYRVPPDTTVSPLRAGHALHAITSNGPNPKLLKWERQPVITIPPQRRSGSVNDPFPTLNGGWFGAAFPAARRGFTSAEREFLRATADNTAIEEFRILARAPSLDLIGAYWDIQPGAQPLWFELPLPKLTFLKAAAQANIAQAALDFSAGNSRDAEKRIREVISAGFLMMNDGHTIIENVTGAGLVSNARIALAALFELTGRAREARSISVGEDPVTIASEDGYRGRPSLEEVNRELRRMVLDSNEMRGLRWEMLLNGLSWEPCSDFHQIIFGPDSSHLAGMAEARKQLVRTPSEALLFSFAERSAKEMQSYDAGGRRSVWAAHRPVARAVTALTGNHQLESCLVLLGLR